MIDDKMMALKWMDKCPVAMLTTIHDDSIVTKQRRSKAAQGGVEEVRKPLVVKQYNLFMGGGITVTSCSPTTGIPTEL